VQLVDRAMEWVERIGLRGQVHYEYNNATINLATMMSTYPGEVDSVYIQFPDPHFKRRHRKVRWNGICGWLHM
jgi:tRNA (guanine-N7-)-methyltransferase